MTNNISSWPIPPERWVQYYRSILSRIAGGYQSPQTLADFALNWTIHTDTCNSKKGEWEKCDCTSDNDFPFKERHSKE